MLATRHYFYPSQVVLVRSPADGSLRPRDVRQLSGGERRRVALALSLGFEALVRARRRLVSNLIVLDEVRAWRNARKGSQTKSGCSANSLCWIRCGVRGLNRECVEVNWGKGPS